MVRLGGGGMVKGVVMRFILKIDIMSLLRWCHNKIILVAENYFTVVVWKSSDTLLWKMIMMISTSFFACTAVSKKQPKVYCLYNLFYISLSALCQSVISFLCFCANKYA